MKHLWEAAPRQGSVLEGDQVDLGVIEALSIDHPPLT
jgi:hypothetical protein